MERDRLSWGWRRLPDVSAPAPGGPSGREHGRPGNTGSRGRPTRLPRPRGPAPQTATAAPRPPCASTPAPIWHSPPRPAHPGPGAALHGVWLTAVRPSVPPLSVPSCRCLCPAGGSEPLSCHRPGSDVKHAQRPKRPGACSRPGAKPGFWERRRIANGEEPGLGRG